MAFGKTSPDSELNAIIQRVGTAFQLDWAVTANYRGLPLFSTADKEGVWIFVPAFRLGDPLSSLETGAIYCLIRRRLS